ncbi:DUF1801 domain-containing protein [Kitasatospora sp. DSM 101779]|uniref:DUF1801 domain-containing protein n=1 Tax=Kitasatospora sp. DSM 101779 TaxID=2853165 RepID=UPI0021D837F0|nr:DUF1801 domain-containing protein [Kitasatospora sp. DSM 101779]MCU7826863.1 DUF1801 domain-containing protein [Kitasatospora sp. DSM 101779]
MHAVQEYVEAITPEHRPLFVRVSGLILEAFPGTSPTPSYGMPTYRLGHRRRHVGAWRRGVPMYGRGKDRDGGFTARHPALVSGRGTTRLRPENAEGITDDELRDLVRAALEA